MEVTRVTPTVDTPKILYLLAIGFVFVLLPGESVQAKPSDTDSYRRDVTDTEGLKQASEKKIRKNV